MNTWGSEIFRWTLVVATGLSLAAPAIAGPTRDEVSSFLREGEYSTTARHGRIVAKVDSKKRTAKRAVPSAARGPASVTQRPVAKKAVAKKSPIKKRISSKVRSPKSKNHRVVSKPVRSNSRRPASVKSSPTKKLSSKRVSRKKVAKKTPTRTSRRPASKNARSTRSRVSPRESDLPLVSVPRSRVRREDKLFVMDDPGQGPKAMRPDPEVVGEEPSTIDRPAERAPAETPATVTPSEMGGTPAMAPEAGVPEDVAAAVREPDAFDLHSGKDPMRPATE